jgi:CDP-glucose 4,6-dehydratase
VARCGNIYGGGDLNWSRIVPGTIRSLFQGQRPVIRSDGKFTRDYLYVEDVVDAYLVLAERCKDAGVRGEAFNFSPESRQTVLEITQAIQRLMRREDLDPIILDNARAEIRDQYLDATRAHQRLGWRARYSLDEGLQATIAWYSTFLGTSKRLAATSP